MAKKGHRQFVRLVCTKCGNSNYITQYNKINENLKKQTSNKETFPLMKFCARCNKHTSHKMDKKLK